MLHPASFWLGHQARRLLAQLGIGRNDFAPWPAPELEHPAQTLPCRPALLDEDQLARVTGCGFGRTLAEQIAVLRATHYRENPMERYHLTEAVALGGLVMTPRAWHMLIYRWPGLGQALRAAPVRDRTLVANSTQGLGYFGHWLGDDVSAFEAHRDDPDLMSLPLPDWGDVPNYQRLFGQHWRAAPVLRSRSMTLLRDIGFGRGKTARWRTLRARLRDALPGVRGAEVVCIRRGASATQREIANWPVLERRLTEAGVRIITPESDTVGFLRTLMDAAVIISVEGSQLCHAIYALRDGGGLVVLQPPDRFYCAPQEWMRALDMHCGMVVGTSAPGGFDIDPDEVMAMLDRVLERVHGGPAA